MAEIPLDPANYQKNEVPLDPANYQFNEVPLNTGDPQPQPPPVPGRKPEPPTGLREEGNIDLGSRPRVDNGDGYSTVLTMGIGTDKGEVNIPRVSEDGRIMDPDEARAEYEKTGRHLGIYGTVAQAEAAARRLHEDQAIAYDHPQERTPAAVEQMTAAREAGYSWADIDTHLGNARLNAANFGYTDAEIDDHLGYLAPGVAADRMTADMIHQIATDPTIAESLKTPTKPDQPTLAPLFNENTMDEYKRALLSGEVKGPADFAQQYAAAHGRAMDVMTSAQDVRLPGAGEVLASTIQTNLEKASRELEAQLPDMRELTDAAIGVANMAGTVSVDAVRRQLMEEWSRTGERPMALYQQALNDPILGARLTAPSFTLPSASQFAQGTLNLVERLATGAAHVATAGYQGAADVLENHKELVTALNAAVIGIGNPASPDLLKAYMTATKGVATVDRELGEMMRQANTGGPLGIITSWGVGLSALTSMFIQGSLNTAFDVANVPVMAGISSGFQLIGEAFDESSPTPRASMEKAQHFMNEVVMPVLAELHLARAGLAPTLKPGARDPAMLFVDPLKPALEALRPGKVIDMFHEVMHDESGELKPAHSIERTGQPGIAMGKTLEEAAPERWSIKDPTGAPVGTALITKAGTSATVESIRYTGEGSKGMYGVPNALGPRAVRDVFRDYFTQNPDVDTINGYRVTGARTVEGQEGARVVSMTREAVMRQPGKVYEAMGVEPSETVHALMAEHAPKEGTMEAAVKDLGGTPEAQALAGGYDIAGAIYSHFHDIMMDQSGNLNIFRTMQQKMDLATYRTGRDFVQGLVREKAGLSEQFYQHAFDKLEEHRKVINQHMPAYLKELTAGPAGTLAGNPIHEMIKFIEGRSTGAVMDKNSPLYPVANSIRDLMENMRTQIEQTLPGMNKSPAGWAGLGGFYEDYYRHLWAKPGEADRVFGGKQGSGASVKLRHIPTLSEGIDKGLMPKYPDPIENTLNYVKAMGNYLAAQQVLQTSEGAGFVKYYKPGDAPTGWTQLTGLSSSKSQPMFKNGVMIGLKPVNAYATPGFARSYNNWLSRGAYGTAETGSVYDKLQYAANALTGLKLMIPAYHAMAMASEASIASIALGIGELGHGIAGGGLMEIARGFKDIGLGGSVIGAVADNAIRGQRLQRKYLDMAGDEVSNLFAMAGGRAVGRQEVYRFGEAPSIIQSISRGALRMELAADVKAITAPNKEMTPAVRAGYALTGGLANFVGKEVGRILNTGLGTSGLFDHMIPWLKQGAFGAEMSDFLRSNPLATREQKMKQARILVDSMDNRFGELNQNNLFWRATFKQAANLVLVSTGWEYGSLRAFAAAGGWDTDKGLGGIGTWNPVAFRWALGFAIGASVQNSMYQYAKTGTLPWQTDTKLLDLIAPRTGGVTGKMPERAVLPGYQKDIFNVVGAFLKANDPFTGLQNVSGILSGKGNPFWQLAWTAGVSGTDRIGHHIANMPIIDPNAANPKERFRKPNSGWDVISNYLHHVFLPALLPISVENLSKGSLKGTGLSQAESFAGIRTAPKIISDTEGAQLGIQKQNDYLNKQEMQRAVKENKKLETPDPDVPNKAPKEPSKAKPKETVQTPNYFGQHQGPPRKREPSTKRNYN